MKFIFPLRIHGRWSIWSDYNFDTTRECQEYTCSICRWYRRPNCTNGIETNCDPENHEINASCWCFTIAPMIEGISEFFANQKYDCRLHAYNNYIRTKNFVVFIWKLQKGKVVLRFDKRGKPFIYYQGLNDKCEHLTDSLEDAFTIMSCNNFDLRKECMNLYKG